MNIKENNENSKLNLELNELEKTQRILKKRLSAQIHFYNNKKLDEKEKTEKKVDCTVEKKPNESQDQEEEKKERIFKEINLGLLEANIKAIKNKIFKINNDIDKVESKLKENHDDFIFPFEL